MSGELFENLVEVAKWLIGGIGGGGIIALALWLLDRRKNRPRISVVLRKENNHIISTPNPKDTVEIILDVTNRGNKPDSLRDDIELKALKIENDDSGSKISNEEVNYKYKNGSVTLKLNSTATVYAVADREILRDTYHLYVFKVYKIKSVGGAKATLRIKDDKSLEVLSPFVFFKEKIMFKIKKKL